MNRNPIAKVTVTACDVEVIEEALDVLKGFDLWAHDMTASQLAVIIKNFKIAIKEQNPNNINTERL